MIKTILKVLLAVLVWYLLSVLLMSAMMAIPALRTNPEFYGILSSVIATVVVVGFILLKKRFH